MEYIYYETKRGRCRYPAERKTCPVCGTEALMLPHVTHCSRKCAGITRRGPANPSWKGDAVKRRAARSRGHLRFPVLLPCEDCGRTDDVDRHHIDSDTRNNDRSNIAFLCPACHGRRHRKPRRACATCGAPCRRATNVYCSRACQGKAQATARATLTHCKHGHEFTPENTRIGRNGDRVCLACHRRRGATYRQRISDMVAATA